MTTAGVGGDVSLVARADATKLAVDPTESDDDLTDLAVEDDFTGRLYDAPLAGPDAVYVHRGGTYTTELRDAAGEVGADRVCLGDDERVPHAAEYAGLARNRVRRVELSAGDRVRVSDAGL